MKKKELKQHIFRGARAYAAWKGVKFGHGSEGDIERFAGQAADKIFAEPADQQDARRGEADENFRRLIDQMIVEGVLVHDNPPGVIGEKTLERALDKKFRIMWPFED